MFLLLHGKCSRTGFTFVLNLVCSTWMCASALIAFNMGRQ